MSAKMPIESLSVLWLDQLRKTMTSYKPYSKYSSTWYLWFVRILYIQQVVLTYNTFLVHTWYYLILIIHLACGTSFGVHLSVCVFPRGKKKSTPGGARTRDLMRVRHTS